MDNLERKRPRWRLIVGILLLLGVGFAGAWGYRLMTALGGGKMNIRDTWEGIAHPKESFNSKRPVILVVGRDYNIPYNSRSKLSTKNSRADTIMLVSADLDSAKLTAISIPRDTLVHATDGQTGKINATLARGGIDLLMDTIASEFGVRPDYYVLLKADAVRNLVDSVGGVDVNPIDRMFYEDFWGNLSVDLQSGEQHINGKQAVGYVRFRKSGDHKVGPKGERIPVPYHSSKEEGDIRRTERQQELVRALAREALKPQNFGRAPELVNVAFEQVHTNLQPKQLLSLATIFRSSTGGLAGGTLPGKDGSHRSEYVWEPDKERATLMLHWLLNDDQASGRRLTRVAVYNASEERGANSKAVEQLRGLGFEASAAGRSSDTDASVTYRKAAFESYAQEIAQMLGITVVKKDFSQGNQYWLPEIKVVMTQPMP